MRIGLITGEYPPDQGGVGDFTDRLARAMVNQGNQVHVITSSPAATGLASEPSDLGSPPPEPTVHRVVDSWHFGCWHQILKLSQRLRLDILDVQYQAAAYGLRPAINLVPLRRPLPVVVTFHDLKVPYLFPKAGPLRWWVVRALAQRADAVIVTNREDELRLSRIRSGISHLRRIPIGSNIPCALPAAYDRDAERARWHIRPGDLLLGYFGFLNESKGGEELIRALGLLAEEGVPAHLLKIGGRVGTSDPTNRAYAQGLDQLVVDLGLEQRVHWTGYLSPEQVSASICATDVCVLPFRDGVSFRRGSLLACLAHGRAIVTTSPAVPLPEIQGTQVMLLVEPESPLALARAVRQIASKPRLRAGLEESARALASKFTWDEIGQRTADLFAGLVHEV